MSSYERDRQAEELTKRFAGCVPFDADDPSFVKQQPISKLEENVRPDRTNPPSDKMVEQIATAIIKDVCELPGDADGPEALNLTVSDLRVILERNLSEKCDVFLTNPPTHEMTLRVATALVEVGIYPKPNQVGHSREAYFRWAQAALKASRHAELVALLYDARWYCRESLAVRIDTLLAKIGGAQ